MGQLLFFPPDVGGWDYTRWLDTARWQGRLTAVNHLLLNDSLNPQAPYAAAETPHLVSSALTSPATSATVQPLSSSTICS